MRWESRWSRRWPARKDDYDLSTLVAVVSSAALFSSPVKDQFFVQLPNLFITDAVGSSEGGNNGLTVVTAGQHRHEERPHRAPAGQDGGVRREPRSRRARSGVIGKIARAGDIPQGYYNDPKKTAEVFMEVRGTRYVRGVTTRPSSRTVASPCWGAAPSSSTPAARRSSPRRSSRRCARTPTSSTPSCAALPDERWGQTVAAIIAAAAGPRRADARVDSGALPGVRRRARCRASCTSSTRWSARRRASPTTRGRRRHRERRSGSGTLASREGLGGCRAVDGRLGPPRCVTVNARPTDIDALVGRVR